MSQDRADTPRSIRRGGHPSGRRRRLVTIPSLLTLLVASVLAFGPNPGGRPRWHLGVDL